MKKFLIILLLFINIFPFSSSFASASTDEVYYRVNNPNTYLYSDSSLSNDNQLFLLPETYFVKTTLAPNQNVLNVEYNGITGYVDINNLTLVYDIPHQPFAQHNITLLPISNAIIYSRPTTTSTYLGILPYDATSIYVFGKCSGQTPTPDASTDWYYIKYSSTSQGIITGYIYQSVLASFTPASPNTEVLNTQPTIPSGSTGIIAPELQNSHNILIIILLLVPALLLVYLLIRPRKKRSRRSVPRTPMLNYTAKNAPKDEFDF